MQKQKKRTERVSAEPRASYDFPKLLLWLVIVAAIVQILQGLFLPIVGDDAQYHLNWLEQFSTVRSSGVGYPRWLPLSYGGFGSPTFYFYPPLPYFIGSALQLFASDLSTLYHLLGLIATILSALACYYYLRVLGVRDIPSVAASILYTIAPYRFVDLYVRNALGEHFSFIFLPLILASIELCLRTDARSNRARALAVGALGWAGSILAHVPATIMFSIVATVYAVVRMRKQLLRVWPAVGGAVLGAAVAALYIIPVFELRDETQMNHLFDIGSQVQKWSYVLLEIFQSDLTPARILNAFTLALVVLCITALLRALMKRKQMPVPVMVPLVLLLIGLFFQLPGISAPVWEISPINLIKYSWRWNVVTTLGLALVVASLSVGRHKWPIYAAAVTVFTTTIALGMSFSSQVRIHRSLAMLKDFYLDAPEYVPKYGLKNYYEVARFAEVAKLTPDVIHVSGKGKVRLISRTPERLVYSADVVTPLVATFHLFYWPQWKMWQGTQPIEFGVDQYGRVAAELVPGRYEFEMRLERTPGERTGAWISAIASALLLGLFGYLLLVLRKSKPVSQPST